MAKKQFDQRHMVVSRQKVFNRHTGRWLGHVDEFTAEDGPVPQVADSSKPYADDQSKADLVDIAREVSLPGYSSLDKGELTKALLEIGAIQPGSNPENAVEDEDGEDQPETDESADESDTTG